MFHVEIFWNFDTGVQKNIFWFLSEFAWNESCSSGFSVIYVFETLNFIPYGFDSHFRIFNLHSNHERTFFGSFQLLL